MLHTNDDPHVPLSIIVDPARKSLAVLSTLAPTPGGKPGAPAWSLLAAEGRTLGGMLLGKIGFVLGRPTGLVPDSLVADVAGWSDPSEIPTQAHMTYGPELERLFRALCQPALPLDPDAVGLLWRQDLKRGDGLRGILLGFVDAEGGHHVHAVHAQARLSAFFEMCAALDPGDEMGTVQALIGALPSLPRREDLPSFSLGGEIARRINTHWCHAHGRMKVEGFSYAPDILDLDGEDDDDLFDLDDDDGDHF